MKPLSNTLFINRSLTRLLLVSAICISSVAGASASTDASADAIANTSADKSNDNTNSKISDTIAHGKKIHKNHCYKCHTDEVYTRENRFVKSIDALSKQVTRCKDGNDIPWFDDDTDAVVQFLNNKYYRF